MEVPDIKSAVKDDNNGIEVLVDIRTCELTLSEVMELIRDYQIRNPGKEVWMDGDAYAILSMDREATA